MKFLGVTARRLPWSSRPQPAKQQEAKQQPKKTQQLKKTQPYPPCSLPGLSTDLILLIAARLPPHGRLVLAQTCRPLRDTISLDSARLSHVERVDYLACLARDLPDRWACEVCVKLHPIHLNDFPQRVMGGPTCSWSLPEVRRRRWGAVRHHHVQLALKYARAGARASSEHQKYLAELLAPTLDKQGGDSGDGLMTRISVYPRIVSGRFLLHTEWRYEKRDHITQVSSSTIKFPHLCHHQFYRRFTCPDGAEFSVVVDNAFRDPEGYEWLDSCPRCPTDFSIQVSPDSAVLSCWQDLRPECSPTAEIWRAHVTEHVSVHHEPGSIRELFKNSDK